MSKEKFYNLNGKVDKEVFREIGRISSIMPFAKKHGKGYMRWFSDGRPATKNTPPILLQKPAKTITTPKNDFKYGWMSVSPTKNFGHHKHDVISKAKNGDFLVRVKIKDRAVSSVVSKGLKKVVKIADTLKSTPQDKVIKKEIETSPKPLFVNKYYYVDKNISFNKNGYEVRFRGKDSPARYGRFKTLEEAYKYRSNILKTVSK